MKGPERFKTKGISASMLKWIAVLSMCIDHAAVVVLKGYFHLRIEEIPEKQWRLWELWYDGMRAVGRMAFPLFAFLLVEGFYYTKSRKNYGMRLFITALCSEIPYDLAVYGRAFCPERQNTVFTLLLGFLVLNIIWKLRFLEGAQALAASALVTAAGCALACICRVDYSWKGILLIVIFYFFHGYKRAAAAAGFCIFLESFWSIFAFFLILFYNGKKGRTFGGKINGARYLFYLFYPLHLLILWQILQVLAFGLA